MTMKHVRVVVGVALTGIVAACGSQPTTEGALDGDYRIVGGPAPGIDKPYQGTVWAFAGNLDWAHVQEARPIAHVSTDTAGRFTMSLPPGGYTLFGAGSSLTEDGCGAPVVVNIGAASRATAHLVCSVP